MKESVSHFKTADGVNLHTRQWRPDTPPRAALVFIHGYSDHGARYGWVASHLTQAGIAVSAPDLRGHGASPGKRAYIASFDQIVDDVAAYVEAVRQEFHGLPLFVMGHSMGGLVVALYAATKQPSVDGLILSSPLLKVSDDVPPFLQRIAGVIGTLLPWLPVLPMNVGAVSRDPDVVKACMEDPLGYHGRILARTGAEMIRASNGIQQSMEQILLPLLVLHGTDDGLCDVNGSRHVYARSRSTDKTLKLFEGGYHELFNDLDKDVFIKDVLSWLDSRLTATETVQ